MINQSPDSKIRVQLEDDIMKGQDEDWDDLLTPSIVQHIGSDSKGVNESRMQPISNNITFNRR